MPSGCTTCTETWGNGLPLPLCLAPIACSGAATIVAPPATARRPSAVCYPPTSAASSVSGWLFLRIEPVKQESRVVDSRISRRPARERERAVARGGEVTLVQGGNRSLEQVFFWGFGIQGTIIGLNTHEKKFNRHANTIILPMFRKRSSVQLVWKKSYQVGVFQTSSGGVVDSWFVIIFCLFRLHSLF